MAHSSDAGNGGDPDALSDAKRRLRASARAARAALDDAERATRSAQACTHLLALPELHGRGTVLLYAATGTEADPSHVLETLRVQGWRVLLPRVVGDHLEVARLDDPLPLREGFRGIGEPAGMAVDPELIDVAVVPGVAFDLRGGRLGQGGGHYDRLLPLLRPECSRVAFGFACQVTVRVPTLPHDQPVDVVVTEAGVHRITPLTHGPA